MYFVRKWYWEKAQYQHNSKRVFAFYWMFFSKLYNDFINFSINLHIIRCSFNGGKGMIVSPICEPEISLNVVPVALCMMSFVHTCKQ